MSKQEEWGIDNGIVNEELSEMMVTEYDYSPTHNQESALYENLTTLQISHEKFRELLKEAENAIVGVMPPIENKEDAYRKCLKILRKLQ